MTSNPSPSRRRHNHHHQHLHHHGGNSARVASGICVERKLASFDNVPRIPLGARPPSQSSGGGGGRRRGGGGEDGGDGGGGGGVDWPLPLSSAPVCISPSGRYLFSGGHASGALLMWQFDYATGQVSLCFSFVCGGEVGCLGVDICLGLDIFVVSGARGERVLCGVWLGA